MATCDYCGSTILFGGKRSGNFRFCNATCEANGYVLTLSDQLPQDIVDQHAQELHEGRCPKCGGRGPVDVHTSYTIWSALVLTSWKSRPQICCRGCGLKAKLGDAALSAVAGWWGLPWGLVFTPVQIIRNLAGLFSSPDPRTPSAQLVKMVRLNLAAQVLQRQQAEASRATPLPLSNPR